MILFIASITLFLVSCVSPYRYFPQEPNWKPNDYVITNELDNYVVTSDLVHNYIYQKLFLEEIRQWRIYNGIK